VSQGNTQKMFKRNSRICIGCLHERAQRSATKPVLSSHRMDEDSL
jgi:hypothetical protein